MSKPSKNNLLFMVIGLIIGLAAFPYISMVAASALEIGDQSDDESSQSRETQVSAETMKNIKAHYEGENFPPFLMTVNEKGKIVVFNQNGQRLENGRVKPPIKMDALRQITSAVILDVIGSHYVLVGPIDGEYIKVPLPH